MDKYTLKTAFRKSFLGMVWRIEADTTATLLAIETRNEDTGMPLFSAIEYDSGVPFMDEKPYGDRTWSLAGIVEDNLILRAWGQHTPDGAGIACINATTGDVLWEQFNYTLVAIQHRQLVVRHRNFASGYEQRMNPLDGNLTQINNPATKPDAPKIVLPERYRDDKPLFLERYPIQGDLFYCQVGDRMVWAFHEVSDHTYCIRIAVSRGLKMLADRVMVSGLARMAPELFFMINNQVFFIGDNKREIVSYLV
ncbi:hypothetical protein GCM10011386_42610 [Parapedobacter defluvii]|uniref:DUF4905 domain-containing protein n=2 Tax=Parapedobacter defluvii TaxID=2045106 RepID=A0ABQ1MSX1_9SPHI|nr:hypothetical protein GCM10011386_42610 [Parapedobacter defluvii]